MPATRWSKSTWRRATRRSLATSMISCPTPRGRAIRTTRSMADVSLPREPPAARTHEPSERAHPGLTPVRARFPPCVVAAVSASEAAEIAGALKLEGNEHFKAARNTEALESYESGVKACKGHEQDEAVKPLLASLHLNLAAECVRLELCVLAAASASCALECGANVVKSRFRRFRSASGSPSNSSASGSTGALEMQPMVYYRGLSCAVGLPRSASKSVDAPSTRGRNTKNGARSPQLCEALIEAAPHAHPSINASPSYRWDEGSERCVALPDAYRYCGTVPYR